MSDEYDCVLNGCGENVPCAEDCKCECTYCQRNRPTYEEEEEEDDCVIPQCCNDANGCSQCCSEEEEDDMKSHPCECGLKECSDCFPEEEEEGEEGDQCEECYTKAATKCEMCGNSLCHYHTRGKDKESADLCKGCFGKEEEESK